MRAVKIEITKLAFFSNLGPILLYLQENVDGVGLFDDKDSHSNYNTENMLERGLKYTSEMVVTDAVTATAVGSGDMPVLATPAMMALMENASMLAVANELPIGFTTVGGYIESSHLRPTAVGETVRAVAQVKRVDGKKIEFAVAVYCGDTLLGEGTHLRFVVEREKFLSKL